MEARFSRFPPGGDGGWQRGCEALPPGLALGEEMLRSSRGAKRMHPEGLPRAVRAVHISRDGGAGRIIHGAPGAVIASNPIKRAITRGTGA